MGQSIFIAYPETARREELAAFFKKNAFEVSSAKDGAEALQLLSSAAKAPDIILLSAQLSETPTIEVCQQLKKDPKVQRAKFIILIPEDMESQPYNDIGINDLVDDPFDENRLLSRINVIMQYGRTPKSPPAQKPQAKLLPVIIIGIVVLLFILFLLKLLT